MSPLLETLSLIDLDDALVVNPNLRWFKIFDSFTFQNTCALDCSKLMEVKIGLKNNHAIISFNDMLPLETDTTESKAPPLEKPLYYRLYLDSLQEDGPIRRTEKLEKEIGKQQAM
uniref:Uncharacterized protein n=1 Tax=Solanum tuberosum TaxID=4113 RepID=M1CJW2_SOLTU